MGPAHRYLVHDYAGHPFSADLSRELARRGHEVLHLYFADGQSPKGDLVLRPGDADGLRIEGVDLGEPFQKHHFVRRLRQERAYGRLFGARVKSFQPDAILSGNGPLDPQDAGLRAAHETGAAFVAWVQDLYSVAIDRILRRRMPIGGALISWRFKRLESRILRQSDAVVLIADDFRATVTDWGVPASRQVVIPNWGSLSTVSPGAKDNPWSRHHGLADKHVLLYCGTLGLKHDPGMILALAESMRDDPETRVVVVSEGLGADWLRAHGSGLSSLVVLPFQPAEVLSDVVATADVTLAILEPDAGTFSVPSKVLTYMAAGRPVVAAVPASNLAARTIERAKAGVVVAPGDQVGFFRAAGTLLGDPDACGRLGTSARAYAVDNFTIGSVADQFELVLDRATAARHRVRLQSTRWSMATPPASQGDPDVFLHGPPLPAGEDHATSAAPSQARGHPGAYDRGRRTLD